MIVATVLMGLIGFLDDYIKVIRKNKEGLQGKFKVVGQVVLGLIVAITMLLSEHVVVRLDAEEAELKQYPITEYVQEKIEDRNGIYYKEYAYVKTTMTNLPFFKGNELEYADLLWFLGENAERLVWVIFIPIIIFIVTAVSNAANLTDGIDGLAAGVSGIIGGALLVLAYVSGNTVFADYLNVVYIPGSQELVIFSACLIGACVGFLWHNAYPAQVFMGDTGSLTLGGIIATLAILVRKELLIPGLCGIFLVENLSVVLQVSYFKYTKRKYGEGRRIFKMSPLHHHYQKLGMHEVKIVIRFWIIAILLALLTILTLKIR
jgi:phospho-N-acetylmuramoyl-pentapeptide-transferase